VEERLSEDNNPAATNRNEQTSEGSRDGDEETDRDDAQQLDAGVSKERDEEPGDEDTAIVEGGTWSSSQTLEVT
jgi:hypothetical protein